MADMTEALTFDDYQAIAHSTSVVDTLPDPEHHLVMKTLEETMEAFFEDGLSHRFLILHGFYSPTEQESAGIAKEFGDVMWFISEYASRRGQQLGELALAAANRHAPGLVDSPLTFRAFDQATQVQGANFSVVNYKMSFSAPVLDETARVFPVTTLGENAGYVLQRVFMRLACNTGGEEARRSLLFSNVFLDSAQQIEEAPGDALWTMAATANLLLGTSLGKIAASNVAKIQRRQQAGTTLSGNDIDRSGNSQTR